MNLYKVVTCSFPGLRGELPGEVYKNCKDISETCSLLHNYRQKYGRFRIWWLDGCFRLENFLSWKFALIRPLQSKPVSLRRLKDLLCLVHPSYASWLFELLLAIGCNWHGHCRPQHENRADYIRLWCHNVKLESFVTFLKHIVVEPARWQKIRMIANNW